MTENLRAAQLDCRSLALLRHEPAGAAAGNVGVVERAGRAGVPAELHVASKYAGPETTA